MALFPLSPVPSSIAAPSFFDPMLAFSVDSGYELRRPRTSRPRRRFLCEWLGKTTTEMRQIMDFVLEHRLGSLSFEWYHMTAYDTVPASATTPVILTYQHGLVTGQWVAIGSGPPGLVGFWPVTRLNATQISLNGTTSAGAANVTVIVYLPNAVARFEQDTWGTPVKLIGPDQLGTGGRRQGYFSYSLVVEEVF